MITTIDDKDIVKEDDSTNDTTAVVVTIVCDSLKTDREDGAKQSQEGEEEVRDNRNCALFQSVRTHEGWLAILNGCDVCLTGYDILLSVSRWSRLFTMIDRLKFVVFPIFRSYIGQRFIARFSFYTSPNRVQSVFKKRSVCKKTVLQKQQRSSTESTAIEKRCCTRCQVRLLILVDQELKPVLIVRDFPL